MRRLLQSLALGLAVIAVANGCKTIVRNRPQILVSQLRDSPPVSVAVLPFENQSDHPMAAGMARDTLVYALTGRGFQMVDLNEIDRKISDPQVAAQLRQSQGGINAKAAGPIFQADAIAVGRVERVQSARTLAVAWTRLEVKVWLLDTRTEQLLWHDSARALVRTFVRPRRRKTVTPAESQQGQTLRLCRSFDAMWRRLARQIPDVAPQPRMPQLRIHAIHVHPTRPVVSPGDSVEIAVEAAPGCVARATLGTLGKTVALEETAKGQTSIYSGTYTVERGDRSSYARVIAMIESKWGRRHEIADPRTGFIVDTTPPEPPTALVFKTVPNGVILSWDPPPSPDVAHYMVYRSRDTQGAVRPVGRPVETEYLDATVRGPGRFLYFVKAIDLAGNPSSSSVELTVSMPSPGPSTVGGTLEGEHRWTAFGGPYRLATVDVDVAPGARLVIEPGTRIEIPPGMEIMIRGTVEAIGTEQSPIDLSGTDASRGFHLAAPGAVLHASHLTVSGANRALEVGAGACYMDYVRLRDNEVGLDAREAERLTLTNTTFLRNDIGATVGGGVAIRNCAFVQNAVGLRVIGDGTTVERCRFDNIQLDIVKIGRQPLAVDGNTFWTGNPSKLFRHVSGNVTCRSIRVRSLLGGREKPVRFEPVATYLARGENAAVDSEWERALQYFQAALLQQRDRDVTDKALKMYKQIVETQGPAALMREIAFCQSAVLTFPEDLELLRHLARLYERVGNPAMAEAVRTKILRINPDDEFARTR